MRSSWDSGKVISTFCALSFPEDISPTCVHLSCEIEYHDDLHSSKLTLKMPSLPFHPITLRASSWSPKFLFAFLSPASTEGVSLMLYDTDWLCYFPAGILRFLPFVPRLGSRIPKGLPGWTSASLPSWFYDSRLLAYLPLTAAGLRGFLACDRFFFLPEDFRTAVPPGGYSYPHCLLALSFQSSCFQVQCNFLKEAGAPFSI